MHILLINNGSRHIDELRQLLQGHEVRVVRYRRHTRLDREWADMFMLSGGHIPAILRAYYDKEKELIRSTSKPVLGICLGFELIARSFGESLQRHERIRGVNIISLVNDFLQPEEHDEQFQVYEAHRWRLLQTVRLETLAISDRGIEAIKHPTRPILGFQFHPEVTRPANEGALLFSQALGYLESHVEAARART